MPLKQFRLDTLKDLDDGRVHAAVNAALKMLALDCQDRPGNTAARKMSLEIRITPVVGQDGDCEDFDVMPFIKTSLPAMGGKAYRMAGNRAGMLLFSANNPEDHNQISVFDVNPETGEVDRSIDAE